ncbi:D-glycero-alpha-D-manno-heptose-1,7-bisphosphate 7-phosphatase [Sphingomonas crusticola]|uniref:D-glycero-alpha-D-manno-heptose-1,7-bisphosphate 7-phosphatase n=1 Tax=Sphingomonas crusticola TaxID=1697973 RepID=UPI000E22A381|nr:HAD family hydrolase [Sphingomonas crusticola]
MSSLKHPDSPTRPAAFLDRDGVINVDHGYTFRPEDLELTPTAAEGIRLLNEAGYPVLVVTNQSGVARGLYGTADVELFHRRINEELAGQGARIDAFYYCPYHPDGIVADFAFEHRDRKPGSGMILRAMREWNIARDGSFLIGDKASDAEAAAGAGIASLLIAPNEGDLAAAVRAFLPNPGDGRTQSSATPESGT